MAERQNTTEIPRWARELGDEAWEKINERLDEGFDTMDIARELNIPQSKIRSLQAQLAIARNDAADAVEARLAQKAGR